MVTNEPTFWVRRSTVQNICVANTGKVPVASEFRVSKVVDLIVLER